MSTLPKNPHFLIVDDDDSARETLAEYLRTLGYMRITQAANGKEAISALEQDGSIEFIISDWEMPEINGLTLLQRIKADPTRSHLPYLIVTSPINEEAEKVILAAENLVDGYLIKPFRSQTLKEKINEILSTPIHGPQKQVVVVDDDADSREIVVEYLKTMGFKDIYGLEDGAQALNYLASNASNVCLIVSDWEMPELNGLDLLKACRTHPDSALLREIPFLMITSQSSIERMKVMQAARAQVDQYLLKPFQFEQIKARVEQSLEKSRNRKIVQAILEEASEHLERGRYGQALERFEDALMYDGLNETALSGKADAILKVKDAAAAVPFYKKAIDSNPYNDRTYLKLSGAYESLNQLNEAITLLKAATEIIGFNAPLHFALGKLYNRNGQPQLAKAEFERTLSIQLDHQEARLMLEMMMRNSGGRQGP